MSMLRSSAAVASRAMRLLASSSRPSILSCYSRSIIDSPPHVNPVGQFLASDLVSRFSMDQSRGYARGGASVSDSEDDDDVDSEGDDDVDSEDFGADSEDLDGEIEDLTGSSEGDWDSDEDDGHRKGKK